MRSPYDILKATFCIYCQEEYPSPEKLQTHVLSKHRDTYPYWAIIEAKERAKQVQRLRVQQKLEHGSIVSPGTARWQRRGKQPKQRGT